MEKERQDSAELKLARPWMNLEYLSENTNFYGSLVTFLYSRWEYFYVTLDDLPSVIIIKWLIVKSKKMQFIETL